MAFSTSAAVTDDSLVRPGFLFGNVSWSDPQYAQGFNAGASKCYFTFSELSTGNAVGDVASDGSLRIKALGLSPLTSYHLRGLAFQPRTNGSLMLAAKTRYFFVHDFGFGSAPSLSFLKSDGSGSASYMHIESQTGGRVVFYSDVDVDINHLVFNFSFSSAPSIQTFDNGVLYVQPRVFNMQLMQGQRVDSEKSTDIIGKLDEGQKEQQQQHEETKGLLEGLPGKIGDMLKGLIIPSNEYFSNWFRDLNDWFSARLGFLYTPIDVLFKFCDGFLSADSSIPSIPVPSLSWDGVVFLDAQTVTFEWVQSPAFKPLQEKLYFVGNCAWVFMLLSLLHRKLEEVLHR